MRWGLAAAGRLGAAAVLAALLGAPLGGCAGRPAAAAPPAAVVPPAVAAPPAVAVPPADIALPQEVVPPGVNPLSRAIEELPAE